jgi:quinol monooxygenase YgiN
MGKLTLLGYILAPAAELPAVRAGLADHIAATRAEPGCISFEMSEDPNQPGRFNLEEVFADRDALDEHRARMQASPWAEASKNIERHYEITEEP